MEVFYMKAREILLYLAVKYNGDYEKMLDAIKQKEKVDPSLLTEAITSIKSNYVTLIDPDYPKCLKSIMRPPLVLFYYGDLSLVSDEMKCLSIVGSREMSSYGQKITEDIIVGLENRYYIVSGMAKGIDSIAHFSAIKYGLKTVGVLGCGIDYIYPKENIELYELMKKEHLLISEYPNLVGPDKDHFPFRNRIIAAMSKGLLITEAKKRSGTMITASYAISQGKEVMCVPYDAYSDSANNKLIKDGAFLVENSSDVLYILEK